jgi:hypothetical protein
MTIAQTVALNATAVAGLVAMLTATMRLPYWLPSAPSGELERLPDQMSSESSAIAA